MEKKRNLPPSASSLLVEPPLKQHHQSEAAEQESDQVFRAAEQCLCISSIPFFCTSSTSFGGGGLKPQWRTNSTFLDSSSPAAKARIQEAKARFQAAKARFAATPTPKFRVKTLSEEEDAEPYTLISIPAITEQDGVKTLIFQSCFAIAGADYCLIAADFTNISELSRKSAMASCGFQDDMKALQAALYAENLRYEREHNKPMSCPEMHRLLSDFFQKRHLDHYFIVLGGLDSKGKGRVFQLDGPGDVTYVSEVVPLGSIPNMAPILKYKLPAKDVLARLSETEAVKLAKNVFRSATHTGDKLEIVVLNAKGLARDNVDLRKEKKK